MSTCNSTFGSCSILCESTASIPERILVNLRVTIALLFVSITAQVVTKDPPPGYFLGGYVPPGTPNWHPVLKKISPKIDTPF